MLEGSLRRAGDTVRVIVRLVDAHTGFHIWSQSYDRHADDLLGLQAELASEVVQSLSPSRQAGAIGVGPVRPTASPQAYRLFLEANALVGASDSNLRAALALYDEALALDPKFARALAARAAARLVLVSHGSVGLADLSEAERDARAALVDRCRRGERARGVGARAAGARRVAAGGRRRIGRRWRSPATTR